MLPLLAIDLARRSTSEMKAFFLLLTFCLVSVVSRLHPSLKSTQTASETSAYILRGLRFTSTTVDIGVQELVCFHWSCISRRPLHFSSRPSYLSLCLTLLSGDIELNPGPGLRHPCGSYSRAVRANERGIFCEVCYYWFHTKCVDTSDDEYTRLGFSDEGWCCPNCFREALPFFDSSILLSPVDLVWPVPYSILCLQVILIVSQITLTPPPPSPQST